MYSERYTINTRTDEGRGQMKDAQINIRLREDIKKKLEEKAERSGFKVSEYVRYLINKDLERK
jgi:predicted DNA binding CopG/RHH family protein